MARMQLQFRNNLILSRVFYTNFLISWFYIIQYTVDIQCGLWNTIVISVELHTADLLEGNVLK